MLARAVGVGLSDASQELRRIQSRGLLQVERRGPSTYYGLGADPQVSSAAPLLKALRSYLSKSTVDQDDEFIRIASGLGHSRRMVIAWKLNQFPSTISLLQKALRIPQSALSRHVGILCKASLVRREGRFVLLNPSPHVLAQTLVRLIRAQPSPLA